MKRRGRTTIEIDEALMRKALRASKLTTKRAVVELALRPLAHPHEQAKIGGLFGAYPEWEDVREHGARRGLPTRSDTRF